MKCASCWLPVSTRAGKRDEKQAKPDAAADNLQTAAQQWLKQTNRQR
jgi:hypothetical protein